MSASSWGAIEGLGNGIQGLTNQDIQKKDREMQWRLSPWTHMKSGDMTQPQHVHLLNSVMSGLQGGKDQDAADAQGGNGETGDPTIKAADGSTPTTGNAPQMGGGLGSLVQLLGIL